MSISFLPMMSLCRMAAAESTSFHQAGRWLSCKTPAAEEALLYEREQHEVGGPPDGFGYSRSDAVYLPSKGLLIDTDRVIRDVSSHDDFLEKKECIKERGRTFARTYTFKATGVVPNSTVNNIAKLFEKKQSIDAQIAKLHTQHDATEKELVRLSQSVRKSLEK